MTTKTLYVGSWGPRYGDPVDRFAGLTRESVEQALDSALDYWRAEYPAYCSVEHDANFPESDCSLCNPDIVSYGAWQESTPISSGIMSCAELFETWRALTRGGETIVALQPV